MSKQKSFIPFLKNPGGRNCQISFIDRLAMNSSLKEAVGG